MTLAQWYSRSALSLLVLAIAAYATASRTPEFAVLSIPAVVALWKLSWRKAGRFLLPRFVVNILLFAVLAFAALRAQGRLSVETIAQVVVLIQLIKIGDRRAPRDDAQILCLAVFLAIAAMLDSNDVWTGALLILFLPLLVTSVMLFQLYQGAVNAAGSRQPDAPAAEPAAGIRRGLRVTAGFVTVGTLLLALLVFVLLPRGVGADVFGPIGVTQHRKETGFTSSVTLGAKGIISTSPTIVLDLVVKDEGGENMGTTETSHYLRGAVLSEYNQGKWTAAPTDRKITHEAPLTPGGEFKIAHKPGPVMQQEVSMRGSAGNEQWVHLFAEWRPFRVVFAREGLLRFNMSTFVMQRKAAPGPFEYTVWSALIEQAREDEAAPEPASLEWPRLHGLAASILQKAGIDPDPAVRESTESARAARAIQDYLRTNFEYTLMQESPPAGIDQVEYFLFDRKRGHCEYFASAMVLLCRTIGVQARMVTGYLATEYSSATGAYIVRESNAHAWVEARDGESRWRRFDPTPPEDLARLHRPSLGLLGRLRSALEAVEYAWNNSIVAFNESTRQSLLGPSRGEDAGWLGRVERISERVRSPGGHRLMLSAFLTGLVVFALVASGGFVLAYLLRRYFRWPWQGRGSRGPRRVIEVAFYRALLRALSRRGSAKPDWRPPLEHSQVIAEVDAGLGATVGDIVEDYYAVRFGGRELDAPRRDRVRQNVRKVLAARA